LHIDTNALRDALEGLGSIDRATVDVEDALRRVVRSTKSVFAVSGAGLMLVDSASILRYVVASDEPGQVLETAQEQVGTGPCVDALVNDEVIMTADLAEDGRWPEVAQIVVPAGVRAVLGVPVHVAGGPVGSLNVYCDEPHEWDDSELEAIRAFDLLIEDLLGAAVLMRRSHDIVQQLQYALDHRVVIERAVGVLMGSTGKDAVSAFNELRMLARSRRVAVAEVAAEVVAGVQATGN